MTAFTMVPRAVSNENLRRRRQSPTDDNAPQKLDDCKESTEPHADEAKNIQNKIDSKKSYRKRKTKTWMQWLSYLIHLVAIVVFVAGLILNHQDLHTSVECKMTYSQRQLIPIHVLPHHPKYNLYKFVDQRDPRPHHSNMMKKWLSTLREQNGDDRLATLAYLNETEAQPFCQPTTNTSILYIPGHWGSYMQSRSIGAHGIQLTGARDAQQAKLVVKALSENQWTGETIEKFQYDVYAVDFQEEGAALHAQFLLSQTAFVAQAVHRIQVRL